jgi:hypothetical protein
MRLCKCGHDIKFHYADLGSKRPCHKHAPSWPGGDPYAVACGCKNYRPGAEAKPFVRGKPCQNCGCLKGKHFDLGVELCDEHGCIEYLAPA